MSLSEKCWEGMGMGGGRIRPTEEVRGNSGPEEGIQQAVRWNVVEACWMGKYQVTREYEGTEVSASGQAAECLKPLGLPSLTVESIKPNVNGLLRVLGARSVEGGGIGVI